MRRKRITGQLLTTPQFPNFLQKGLAKFRSLRHLDLNIGPTTVGTAGEKVTAQE